MVGAPGLPAYRITVMKPSRKVQHLIGLQVDVIARLVVITVNIVPEFIALLADIQVRL